MSKKKKTSIRPSKPVVRPRPSLSTLITGHVDAATLAPDFIDLLSADEQDELRDAFVRERCNPEDQAEWGTREQRHADTDQLYAWIKDLPDRTIDLKAVRDLFWLVIEKRGNTKSWMDEEIMYALGIEVGRRMVGGVR